MGGSGKLSPMQTKAKTNVLEQLKAEMQDMMMKKVSNLKEGFGKEDSDGEDYGTSSASNIIKNVDNYSDADSNIEDAEEDMGEDLDHDHEDGESSSHKKAISDMAEGDDTSFGTQAKEDSEDELDKKIKDLLRKKDMMKGK